MKTNPKRISDFILWPILRVIWEPFSRKNAHFWQWNKTDYDPKVFLTVSGNPEASKRESRFQLLLQTNFKWSIAVVLEPIDYFGEYKIGFFSQEGPKLQKQICDVILTGKSAALVGPYDINFFALSYPDNKELQLRVVDSMNKKMLASDVFLV